MASKKQPVVFDDDNPEWTEEDFARAQPAKELLGDAFTAANLVRKRGRPTKPKSDLKQKINLRLSPDVIAGYRAMGPGWQTKMEDALRTWLESQNAA